jgi:hypothetical protein
VPGGRAALRHNTTPRDIQEFWSEIPPRLSAAIMSCIAAEPADRPPTMDKFLERIATASL